MSALLGLVLYPVLLNYGGYVATTFLFIFFLLRVIGKKGWAASVLIAVVLAAGSYILFRVGLGVPLPKGMLTG